jgi:hypothetical protein
MAPIARMKHLQALPVIAALGPALAGAQSMPPTPMSAPLTTPTADRFPRPVLGAHFAYVDGVFKIRCNRWSVEEISAAGDITSRCGDNAMTVTADGNAVSALDDQGGVVAKFTPFLPQLSFPMSVGRKWSGHYDGQEGRFKRWSGDMDCEAAAFEPVHVAAGTVDAFRIECVTQVKVMAFMKSTIRSTNWYAPSLGMVVKSVNEDSAWNFELASDTGR